MIVKAARAYARADIFLAEALPETSRAAAQRLLDAGLVTRSGVPLRKKDAVAEGDCLDVTIPQAQEVELRPENIPLDVVYEDEDLLVINKPKGMVVHPAPGHSGGTLVNALLAHCGASLSGINGEKRPGIVHRIDMDTSGLLIVAKNDFAHRHLAEQLQDHTLARTYEAIVCGNVREDSGTICAPIGRHPVDRKKMAVVPGGREAITHFEVLARYPGYTHIRCRLETGRTHQIRVHMAYQNHPILGDTVYGHPKKELGMDTQCLHARELRFVHPRTGEQMQLCCALPEDFQEVLRKLRARG